MPSKKKQHNIRLSPSQEEDLEYVRQWMRDKVNIDISVSDVFVAALAELKKKAKREKK